MKRLAEKTHLGRYLSLSGSAVYQLLLFLPLLVAYEIAAVVINFDTPLQLRNGADIMVKYALYYVGIKGVFAFVMTLLLFVSLLIVAAFKKHGARLRLHYFPAMLVESSVYAVVIGVASSRLTGIVMGCNPFLSVGLKTSLSQQVMIGIGAGVYEEMVFRVLLVTAIVYLASLLRMEKSRVNTAAIVLSALLFAAFHYVGEFGEGFDMATFVFRFIAGAILSSIYVLRGIGVAAWSHALYDVLLVLGYL